MEKNALLAERLNASQWPASAPRTTAWLGDPIAIKEPTAAYFRRQSGANLVVVGQQEEAGVGMLASALLSLAAQHKPGAAQFYLLDFTPVDAPFADFFSRLSQGLPHAVKYGRRRQLPDFIAAIAAEVDRRLQADESDLSAAPVIYLLISGLQRARDLRSDDEPGFSFSLPGEEQTPPSPAKQFPTILREGPEVGVHTLTWCDTYTNLTRVLDRRSLREFEMRVVSQMSAEDSSNLIDSPAAGKLGLHRALYYSAEEGRLEKFRPYGLPSDQWLDHTLSLLKER